MNQKNQPTAAERPGYAQRLTRFLLPDRLQLPRWDGFGGRWAALLLLTALWLVACLNHDLWYAYDAAAGTVSVFGASFGAASAAAARTVFLGAYSTLCVMYLGAGLAIHGWADFRRQLASSDWGSVIYHVAVVVLLLIGGALLFEKLGLYGGDPKTSSMTGASKVHITTRIAAVGLLGPAAEEFGLRYVCFGALRARMKFIWAALLSSTAFGLLHFSYPDPVKMLLGTMAGLAFCWTYERTRSFATPLAIHLINNLLGV